MPYFPAKAPQVSSADGQALAAYLERELAALAKSQTQNIQALELGASYVAPLRPRLGMIVYADGTHWNPGNGEGPYVYGSDNAWHFLESAAQGVAFFTGLSGNQTVTSGVDVKLTMTNTTLNDGSYYNNSTKKWTPPAGRVSLSLFVATFTGTTSTQSTAIIYKNGARLSIQFDPNISNTTFSGLGTQMNLSSLVDSCNGSDYYEAYTKYVSSDSSAGVIVADNTRTYFCGNIIR